jgi:hypothetical protein
MTVAKYTNPDSPTGTYVMSPHHFSSGREAVKPA